MWDYTLLHCLIINLLPHLHATSDSCNAGNISFFKLSACSNTFPSDSSRYQHKYDELEIRERDLSASYKTLEREKNDIVHYLKRSLGQKEDELLELSEKLQALQNANDDEKKEYNLQLSTLKHVFQQTMDKLTSENMTIGKSNI